MEEDVLNENVKFYNEKNDEITERKKSLKELGFDNGSVIKYGFDTDSDTDSDSE